MRRFRLIPFLFPLRWTQWVGPALLAGATALLLGTIVATSGWLDLSASKPHPRGWASFLHYVFKRSTAHHAAGLTSPADFGSMAQIVKGGAYYGTACAHCHGGPGLGQNPVALSMTPRPQYLMHEIGTFTDAELFWIVKHGVKYSAMPAYPAQDRDDEVWSIVSFLRAMPRMNPAQYRRIAYGDAMLARREADVAPLADRFASHGYVLPHSDEPPVDSYRYAGPAIGFDAFSIDGNVVATCARCHTDHGSGASGGAIPNITLFDQSYFRTALAKYARGNRHSGYMQPVATQLDDAQMTALARYYAAQPRHRSDTTTANPTTLRLGEGVAVAGLPGHGVGACADCHDITRAAAKAYPAIDGQHAAYLAGRLRQFRAMPTPPPGGNPMIGIAKRLDDASITAVADYYASRAPNSPNPIVVSR